MTLTERKQLPLGIGDEVKTYDDGLDGHPAKWVNGIVTEIGDETFVVQWEDLEYDTEYEWQNISIEGNQIFDPKRTTSQLNTKP